MFPFAGGIGGPEMLIVGVIALLLFGKNLPTVAKNLGKSFAEFKKGVAGFQDEFRNAANDVQKTVTYTPTEKKSSVEDRPRVAVTTDSEDDDFDAPKFDVG
ncbi:MAG: twin-arginine translocase TatA/TatE family subunit [Planctomycetota bacterium]